MRFLVLFGAIGIGLSFAMGAFASEQHTTSPHANVESLPLDTSFDAAMSEAMRRMDRGMAITHGGNPDRDFAAMMIAHHQGAIDMAKAELAFGTDPVLRRLAQAIIVEQQQEIDVMRRRLDILPPAAPADSGSTHRH